MSSGGRSISICIRSDLNVTSTLGWSEKILLGENRKSVNSESKGIIHTKIKVLLSFAHPHVVPNPYESLFFHGTQKVKNILATLLHTIKMNGEGCCQTPK